MDYCLECYLIEEPAMEGNNWDTFKAWDAAQTQWKSLMKEGKKLYASGSMSGAKEKFGAAAKSAEDLKAFVENLPQDKISVWIPWILKGLILMWNTAALINVLIINKKNNKAIKSGEMDPSSPLNSTILKSNKVTTAWNATGTAVQGAGIGFDIVMLKKMLSKIRSEREIRPNDYNMYLNSCKRACDKLIAESNRLAASCV